MRFKTSHNIFHVILSALPLLCLGQQRFTPLGQPAAPVPTESSPFLPTLAPEVSSSNNISSTTSSSSSSASPPVPTQPIGIVSLLSTTITNGTIINPNSNNITSSVETRTREEVPSTSSNAYVTADTLTEPPASSDHFVQFNVCSSNPCQNGAVCHNLGENNFTCDCKRGFSGHVCGQQYNACNSNPCRNNSTCTTTPPSELYACDCPRGYTGNVRLILTLTTI